MAVRCGDTITIQLLTIIVFHEGKLLDDYGRRLIDICLASAIRELCEARDSGFVQFVDRNQIYNMIDMLCTR